MEISSIFSLMDITDWWQQQDEKHGKYSGLSKVASDILCIIPHGVGVEFSFTVRCDVIG